MFCQGHYDCYHPYLLPAQSRIWQPVGHLIKAIAPAELVGTMMVHLMYVGFNAHSDVRPSWDLITSCQRGGWHTVTAYPPFHTLHTILIPPPYPVIKHGDQNKAWLTLDFLQLGLVHALPFFALKIFLRHKQSSSLNSQARRCSVSDIWVTSYKFSTRSFFALLLVLRPHMLADGTLKLTLFSHSDCFYRDWCTIWNWIKGLLEEMLTMFVSIFHSAWSSFVSTAHSVVR